MRVTRFVERGELVAIGMWNGRLAGGPQLWVSPGAWAAFVAGVRSGCFEPPNRRRHARRAGGRHATDGPNRTADQNTPASPNRTGANAPGRHRWRSA